MDSHYTKLLPNASKGAKKIIIVDIHSMIGLKKFKIKAKNISAIPELVKYFKKLRLKDFLASGSISRSRRQNIGLLKNLQNYSNQTTYH